MDIDYPIKPGTLVKYKENKHIEVVLSYEEVVEIVGHGIGKGIFNTRVYTKDKKSGAYMSWSHSKDNFKIVRQEIFKETCK